MSQHHSVNHNINQRNNFGFRAFERRRGAFTNSDLISWSKTSGMRETSTQRENIRIDEINKFKTNIEEKRKRNG